MPRLAARRFLFPAALCLLVLACHRPDYFPLRPGTILTFAARTVDTSNIDSTVVEEHGYTFAVTGTRNEPGLGRLVEVELRRDSAAASRWLFQRRRDGVWLLLPGVASDFPTAPGWLRIVEWPLRVDRAWYGNDTRDVEFEVRAIETIETPAGRFEKCFHIRARAPGSGSPVDFWLAPDTGVVRWSRAAGRGRVEISQLVSVI